MSEYSVSLRLQVQQALQSLKNLTGNFQKVDKEVSATTKELEKFEKELKDEGATIKNTIGAQTEYINKLKGIQTGLDKSSKKFKAVSREITKFEGKLKTGTSAVQGLTGALAVVGAGAVLGKITGDVLTLGKEFSAAAGSVRTLTGAEGFDDVQASIGRVVQSAGGLTNTIEANAASYQLLSAGISGAADIESVLAASVDLTTAGFTDQTTAVDALTTVINAYGLEADKAKLLTDQLVQTQNDGKLTIDQYGAALGKVIPTAATLGVGFEEVNAAIAGITLQGQNADIATSGLNSALNKLAAPTKEGNDILGKYGLTVNAATIQSDGLIGTLEKLQKITSDQDKIKLFGTEAFKALGPLLNNFDKFKELLENQTEATGVAKKAVENLADGYDTLAKRNENLKIDVGVEIFKQLQPAIAAVLKPVNQLLAGFLQLPDPIKKVVIGIGVIAGAATGLLLVVAAVGALKAAILAATGATTLFAAASTVLAGAWAVITAPITLAIAAVAALVAGGILLYKNFLPFKQLVDEIGSLFKRFGETAKLIWVGYAAFAKSAIQSVGQIWKNFVNTITGKWEEGIQFVNQATNNIKEVSSDVLEGVSGFFRSSATFIGDVWGRLTGFINNKTRGTGDANEETTGKIQQQWQRAVDFIQRIWARLNEKIASIARGALSGIAEVLSKALGIDVKAALKKAADDAARAVEAAKKGITGGTGGTENKKTTKRTEKEKPTGNLDLGGNESIDTARNAAKSKAQSDRDELKERQERAFESIEQSLSRSIELNSELTVEGKKNTALQRQKIQNEFEYLDIVKKIKSEVAAGQQDELIGLANLQFAQKEKARFAEAASKFSAPFAEGANIDKQLEKEKQLNQELTQTQELLKGSFDIISGELQSGIQGLIKGTKTWGDILSGIANQLSSLFLNAAFSSLGGALFPPNRASGGPVSGGKPYIVGEEGPELFIPGGNGSITNNDQFEAARNAMVSSSGAGEIASDDDSAETNGARDPFAQNRNSIDTTNNLIRERERQIAEKESFNSAIERSTEATMGSGGSMIIETQVINNVEYASVDQVQKASALAVKQARAQVFSAMKNRPAIRRQVGVK